MKGIKHVDVGDQLSKTEYHDVEGHEIASGAELPESPTEHDMFFNTDDQHLYICVTE